MQENAPSGRLKWTTIALVAGLVLSIVTLIVTIVLSRHVEKRELTYSLNPIRTAVHRAGFASDLGLVFGEESLGDADVTAVQIAIWNRGSEPIWGTLGARQCDVRQDMAITTEPAVRILDVSVRALYPDILGFALEDTPETRGVGRVPIAWDVLEQDQGCSVQVLYEGDEEVEFRLEGVIVGQGEVTRIESGVDIMTPEQQLSAKSGNWTVVYVLAGVTAAAFLASSALYFWYRRTRDIDLMIFGYFALGMSIPLEGITIWQLHSMTVVTMPPFSF